MKTQSDILDGLLSHHRLRINDVHHLQFIDFPVAQKTQSAVNAMIGTLILILSFLREDHILIKLVKIAYST